MNHAAGFDAGQAAIESLEFKAEPLIIDSELVQEGGVDIVYGYHVFDSVVSEFVGCAVAEPGFKSSAGEPHRESGKVMIATVALGHRRAAEFGSEHNDGILEHIPLLQIRDQRRYALIDLFRRSS